VLPSFLGLPLNATTFMFISSCAVFDHLMLYSTTELAERTMGLKRISPLFRVAVLSFFSCFRPQVLLSGVDGFSGCIGE